MRCGDVLSCHERILGRAKWFPSKIRNKKATRMESRTSKTSSRKENGCNLLQRCQFQRLKGCEANAMGWIQMFNRDQRPIFGGERTERMEMLADDCATMQLLFASLRAGETREQPLHPRLVSLHLARKSYSATKRGILFEINRSRCCSCDVASLSCKPFHQSITRLSNVQMQRTSGSTGCQGSQEGLI